MEDRKRHLRHIMLYCFKKGSNAQETTNEICTVYGDCATTVQTVRNWFRKFRVGEFNLEDRERSSRPSTTDIDAIKSLVDENSRYSIREIADILNIPRTTIHSHLMQVGYVNHCEVWIPHKLTECNILDRIATCDLLLHRYEKDSFLERLITGDEIWIVYNKVEHKQPSSNRNMRLLPVVRASLHLKKVLLFIWWDWKGVVYYELLPHNQTINSKKYCSQLDELKKAIAKERPELANTRGIVFHHDNTRPYISLAVRNKLLAFDWDVLPHPAYSPDLAPSSYYLFLSLKNSLSHKKFNSLNEIKIHLDQYFSNQSKTFWKNGIMRLPERWSKVIEQNGSYILQ